MRLLTAASDQCMRSAAHQAFCPPIWINRRKSVKSKSMAMGRRFFDASVLHLVPFEFRNGRPSLQKCKIAVKA